MNFQLFVCSFCICEEEILFHSMFLWISRKVTKSAGARNVFLSYVVCYSWTFKSFKDAQLCSCLRWLKTVNSTFIWKGRYNHSLSLDATIMVSNHRSIVCAHLIYFCDLIGYHSNSMNS